jgi:hypothetical protein
LICLEDLIDAARCKTNADVKQVGIEWAIQQSRELKAAGVPVLHYYSMGKSENIRQIESAFLVFPVVLYLLTRKERVKRMPLPSGYTE